MTHLGLDYLDLYLIHWPAYADKYDNWEDINRETWRAMTELYQSGRVRAIGVSNFKPHHLKALLEGPVKPMVDQIELNPGWQQRETVAFCSQHDILIEAWSPLGRGRVLGHPYWLSWVRSIARPPRRSAALVPGQGLSAPAQVRDAQPHPGEPEHLRLRPDPGRHRQARTPAPLRGIGRDRTMCLLNRTQQG